MTKPGKSAYFFYFAAGSVLLPQLTYFYRTVGLSGRQVGILAAVAPFASIVGASLWGALADVSGRHRLVLSSAFIGTVAMAQGMRFGTSFAYLFPFAVLFSLMYAPIIPIIDKSVLAALGNQQDQYGRVRFWGAVGWGAAAPLAGILIGRAGITSAFPVYGVMMIVCLAATFRLKVTPETTNHNKLSDIGTIIKDRRWIFFLSAVFIRGVGGAFVHHYLMVYLAELGASATLRGLALSAATISELAAFFYADHILRRITPEKVIIISIGATALRCFLHFLIHDPVIVLAVQLLHGVTFSIFLVAGVRIAARLAPKGMETVAQGIFTATNFGAGGIVGAYVGGELLDLVGVHKMYLYAAVVTFAGFLWFLFFQKKAYSEPATR